MHLVAGGDVAGGISEPGQAALVIAKHIGGGDELAAFRDGRFAQIALDSRARRLRSIAPGSIRDAACNGAALRWAGRAARTRRGPRTTTRAMRLSFQSRHGRSDAVEVLLPGPVQQNNVGLQLGAIASTRSLLARQFGVTAISTLRIGTQELAVNCAMPKLRVRCASTRPGISAPAVESPQSSSSGRRSRSTHSSAKLVWWDGSMQAFARAPLRVLLRHVGHRADFRRQAEIEAAAGIDDHAGECDRRHGSAEACGLELAPPAETQRLFDEPVGAPGQRRACKQGQLAIDRGQRLELDDRRKSPATASARDKADS